MDVLRETLVGALSALGGLLAGWFGKVFPSYMDLTKENADLRAELKAYRAEALKEADALREEVAGLEDALRDSEER